MNTILRLFCILAALAVPAAALAGNLTGRFATINLDGGLSDWRAGDVMYSASEIGAGAPLNSTFTNVLVANDSNYVYVALQLPAAAAITNTWIYNLFIDTDMVATNGFNGGWMTGGYDRLVEYGGGGTTYSVYSFAGATQPDWNWNFLSEIGYSYTDLVIEWAVPISTLGLTGNQMRMEFNVTGAGTTAETWAYQWESGVGTYTLGVQTPLTIATVEGAAAKVEVSFTKDVDPVSAGAVTNYSLSGGLTVLSATPTGSNPRKVTLTTSPQSRGTNYTLTVSHITDGFSETIPPNTQRSFVSSILIDGNFDDWQGLLPLYINGQGDPVATDYMEAYAYDDPNYIYFRLTLWAPSDFLSSQNNMYIDTDNNFTTGYLSKGGTELLIQGGTGYQQKNGAFNEGPINGLGWLCANVGQTNYEYRISRAGTYASDNLPVLAANTINFAFDGGTNWVPVNLMPPGRGQTIPYTLIYSAVRPGPLSISLSAGQIIVTWPGSGTLQACDSVTSGSWTNVPSDPNFYSTPASESRLFYRLTQ